MSQQPQAVHLIDAGYDGYNVEQLLHRIVHGQIFMGDFEL
jgi:hypothetical protein